MRVICINNGPLWNRVVKAMLSAPELIEGDSYTVENSAPSGYILKEVKSEVKGTDGGYKAARFIECSDINECKMERNYSIKTI